MQIRGVNPKTTNQNLRFKLNSLSQIWTNLDEIIPNLKKHEKEHASYSDKIIPLIPSFWDKNPKTWDIWGITCIKTLRNVDEFIPTLKFWRLARIVLSQN